MQGMSVVWHVTPAVFLVPLISVIWFVLVIVFCLIAIFEAAIAIVANALGALTGNGHSRSPHEQDVRPEQQPQQQQHTAISARRRGSLVLRRSARLREKAALTQQAPHHSDSIITA